MNKRYQYRHFIDDVSVDPTYPKGLSVKYERENGRVFHRQRLGNIALLRGDFNKVWANDLDHEFDYLVQRATWTEALGTVYSDYLTSKFYKTDCSFDEDRQTIPAISLDPIDKYKLILDALDKEYDIVKDLKPPRYEVNYKKQPLLQIAFATHNVLFNIIGETSWLLELESPGPTETNLTDFGFQTAATTYGIIPGQGDMTPDVSGIYFEDGTFGGSPKYTNQNGNFQIRRQDLGGGSFRWFIIETAGSTAVYQYPLDTELDARTFSNSYVFTEIGGDGDTCKFFLFKSFQRVLTDEATVGGNATLPIVDPDINGYTFGYDYMLDPQYYTNETLYPHLFSAIEASDTHSINPTGFPKFSSTAQHFAGEYFNPDLTLPPSDTTRAYPLMQESWREYAMTIHKNSSQQGLLNSCTTDITLRDAYRLQDVIQLLLQQLDPSVSFAFDTSYSDFLFNATNPLTSDAQSHTFFITSKSNITKGIYDNPDSQNLITFAQIEELLANTWRLFWWIDDAGKFRIEHIQYFRKGRSYVTNVISEDLTVQLDTHTNKAWAYRTKKYRYRKEAMPERIKYQWMDEVSLPFGGYPIEMISNFVQKGFVEDRRISVFTSDLDYAQAVTDRISLDGFFILSATFADDTWTVPFTTVAAANLPSVSLQNGLLSMWYLHDKFHSYNLPAQDIRLNNAVTTAVSVKRLKEQVIVMPSPIEPDPMRLITTSIGDGEIDSMDVNLTSGRIQITVLHDLDFDNPGG